MGKRRVIDSKIRSSQSFSALSYRQRDLWQGVIETADDQGRHPGVAAFVRSAVWPYDDVKLVDVEGDLQALEEAGYIYRYEVDGMIYLQIIKWWKYQQMQWAGPSDYPPPNGWTDRLRYHGKGNVITKENWDHPGGFGSGLGSGLGSELPTPREEVKDEVKDEDDDKGEPFGGDVLVMAWETATGLQVGNPTQAVKALNEMREAGVEAEDIQTAVWELTEKGKNNFFGIASITRPAIIALNKRKAHDAPPPPSKSVKAELARMGYKHHG